MTLTEFSLHGLSIAGQSVGLLFSSFMAGFIGHFLQNGNRLATDNTIQKKANYLLLLTVAILILVSCAGKKLYMIVPYKRGNGTLSLGNTLIASILSSSLLILFASGLYIITLNKSLPVLNIIVTGMIESLISSAALYLTLSPYILSGFSKIPGKNAKKSVKIVSILTIFLVLSGLYSLYQDTFVSIIGSYMYQFANLI